MARALLKTRLRAFHALNSPKGLKTQNKRTYGRITALKGIKNFNCPTLKQKQQTPYAALI